MYGKQKYKMWGECSKSKEVKETQQPRTYVTLNEIFDQRLETALRDILGTIWEIWIRTKYEIIVFLAW